MHKHEERGVALVLSLFLMSAMSVMAASLMFLSQTETYASMNYRMMSQSRYAGEAAVQRAADFLFDPAQYEVPSFISATDPLSNFDYSSSPVRCLSGGCTAGRPIVLSAVAGVDSNYPAPSVQTDFDTAAKGTLAAGNAAVEFGAYATLISMQTFTAYGGGQGVVQTWEITGVGELSGARSATVEVVATVETPKVPANNLAAFATDPSCGALYFHGNVTINSYDSRYGPPGNDPGNSTQADGGDVGTNGNLHIEGNTDVQGNVYTPRTGVGSCAEDAVTALTEDASFTTGDLIELPAVVSYEVPAFTAPHNTTVTIDATWLPTACTLLAAASASVMPSGPGQNCFVDVGAKSVTLGAEGVTGEISLPNISISNGYTLVLEGNSSPSQTFNVNSLSGMGNIEVDANTDAMDASEAVVLKVAGLDTDGMTELPIPLDLDQMAWKQNDTATSYDAAAFQIIYGGSGTIQMTGGNNQSAVSIYAPYADFELQGTQDLFGSVLAGTIESFGNAGISYDRRLGRDFYVAGRPMVGTFTWKRF